MSYAQNFSLNFGPGAAGLTLNGQLYDSGGNTVGSAITSGFVDLGDGLYSYIHSSIPDGLRGTFKVWAPSDADLGSIGLALNPEGAEDVADILAYVQALTLASGQSGSGTSGTVDIAVNSSSTGGYVVEPSNFRMVSVAELVTELRELVPEPAFKEAMAQRAIRSSLNEEDHRPVLALTFAQDFDDDVCDYAAPCSGLRVLGVTVRGPSDCDDCYRPAWFAVSGNRLTLTAAVRGSGRITVALPNRFVPDQRTVAMARETNVTGLWAIYLEGQPELPGSGIVRLCGEPWVYAYKSGVTFASAETVSSDTGLDSEEGLESSGLPMPDGVHTVLYAQRLANCGRLPEFELADKLPGATVEWPILYRDGTHREYLLAMAQAKAYAYLINSGRSDRDVQRFATLQKHWEDQSSRLFLKLPKLQIARARKQTITDGFESTFSLRSGRFGPLDGRLARVRRLW